jgi:hypothetical protein
MLILLTLCTGDSLFCPITSPQLFTLLPGNSTQHPSLVPWRCSWAVLGCMHNIKQPSCSVHVSCINAQIVRVKGEREERYWGAFEAPRERWSGFRADSICKSWTKQARCMAPTVHSMPWNARIPAGLAGEAAASL